MSLNIHFLPYNVLLQIPKTLQMIINIYLKQYPSIIGILSGI